LAFSRHACSNKLRVAQYCVLRNFVFCHFMHESAAIDGLRARKKRETRSALAWAAVRLAVERGFDNVRVEDIAASAGVSARTFNNYFSSKAEAIVARHVDRFQLVVAELSALRQEDELWPTIAEAVIGQFSSEGDSPSNPQWLAGVELMLAEPAVQAEFLRQSRLIELEIAAAISERIGAADMLYPRLVAAAVGAAIEVSLDRWLRSDHRLDLRQVMQSAFARMGHIADAGLSPHASRTRE
jgi:AcrR family transcriptional regulator